MTAPGCRRGTHVGFRSPTGASARSSSVEGGEDGDGAGDGRGGRVRRHGSQLRPAEELPRAPYRDGQRHNWQVRDATPIIQLSFCAIISKDYRSCGRRNIAVFIHNHFLTFAMENTRLTFEQRSKKLLTLGTLRCDWNDIGLMPDNVELCFSLSGIILG